MQQILVPVELLFTYTLLHPYIYCIYYQNQAELKDFTRGKIELKIGGKISLKQFPAVSREIYCPGKV
jgi:hypothetical protein